MKKSIILFFALMLAAYVQAQTPQALNYQGVARNVSGQPLVSQAIGLRLTIMDVSNTTLYQETQSVTTNAYGLYNVIIGSGTVVSGTMGNVNWLMGDRYLQVEMDPAGGTSYVTLGSPVKLESVPYALGANSVLASTNGGFGLVGATTSSLWWGFYEGGNYRGYLGSYSGKNEDVDFGTGAGNTIGSLSLTIQAVPKVTIDSIGRMGVGTRFPMCEVEIVPTAGGVINEGNHNGWTGIGIANSAAGPYNLIANGGTYLSFLYNATPTLNVSAANSKMLMDGTTNCFRATNDNVMSLGVNGTRWTAVYATNGTIQTSDERYKTNIQPLAAGLNTVMQLNPISYSWKNENLRIGTGVNYGFSAQELSKVAPDLVIHSSTTVDKETGKLAGDYADAYGVKYAEFTPILVKAIQEQQAQIAAMQQKIAELEKTIQDLRK